MRCYWIQSNVRAREDDASPKSTRIAGSPEGEERVLSIFQAPGRSNLWKEEASISRSFPLPRFSFSRTSPDGKRLPRNSSRDKRRSWDTSFVSFYFSGKSRFSANKPGLYFAQKTTAGTTTRRRSKRRRLNLLFL